MAPRGQHGTMMRSGLLGHDCATAESGISTAADSATASEHNATLLLMEPSSRYWNIVAAGIWFHVLDSIATPRFLFQKTLQFHDEGLGIDGAPPK